MTFKTADRVYETSTTNGTGTLTLAGAVTGFQAFSVMGANNDCPYWITDDTNWETGIGTVLTSPARLQRTTVLASSNGGSAVNWGSGSKKVRCGFPAALAGFRSLSKSVAGSSDVTLTQDEQRRNVLVFTGVLTGNISVIVDATEGEWTVYNNTSGAFSLTFKVSGGTGKVIPQGTSTRARSDGTNIVDSISALMSSLGIGVRPSTWSTGKALEVGNVGSGVFSASQTDTRLVSNFYLDTNEKFAGSGYAGVFQCNNGDWNWFTSSASGTAGNNATMVKNMTLTPANFRVFGAGLAAVGQETASITAFSGDAGLGISTVSSSTRPVVYMHNGSTSGDNLMVSYHTDGGLTFRGSHDFNRGGGVMRFNTSSDGTLKDLHGDAELNRSVDLLESIRLREWNWKEDRTKKRQMSPIAQELYEVFPGSVSVGGWRKDERRVVGEDGKPAVDEKGNAVMEVVDVYKPWGIDKTAPTWHLVAGFQVHQKRIGLVEKQLTDLLQSLKDLRAEFEAYKQTHP